MSNHLSRKGSSSHMTKVGYIIIREKLTSAVVESQCLDVIERINHISKDKIVFIIWFYRIDYLWRDKKSLNSIKSDLLARKIQLISFPFVSLKFPVSWWLIPLVLPQWLFGIVFIRIVYGIKLFHCRSYHAGILASALNKFVRIKYIFDPRSPLPEENVNSGKWKAGGCNYFFWKKIETHLLKNADKILLVSKSLIKKYEIEPKENRIVIIPNNYPRSFETQLEKINIDHDDKTIKLVYLGSLGHWNKINPYLSFFSELKIAMNVQISLTFYTQRRHHDRIKELAQTIGLENNDICTKYVNQLEIADEIQKYTCGLYLMENNDPRLGVKTVEYLRAGIPVIVSHNIEGAAEIISTNQLGIVFEESKISISNICEFLQNVQSNKTLWHDKCVSYAKNHLSPNSVATQLDTLYSKLSSSCIE